MRASLRSPSLYPLGHPVLSSKELPEVDRTTRIADERRKLPDSPGVYLFHDAKGKVLYVGKAGSLKKRVASPFSNPSTRGGGGLLDEIDRIDFIVTQTEPEALLAEQNFI